MFAATTSSSRACDILIRNDSCEAPGDRQPPQWAGDLIPKGWVPVGISGVPQPTVRWMNVGPVQLTEPFFQESADAMRNRTFGAAAEVETSITTLHTGTRHLPDAAPAGIVCHMSRCGSTLLLNALRTAEGVVGLGEPQPFTWLLSAAGRPSGFWKNVSAECLPALTRVFAGYMGGPDRSVVIKAAASSVWNIRTIRSIWPDVACVFVIRDPLEVLVSNLSRPPQWLRDFHTGTERAAESAPPELMRGSATARAAWVVGQLCECGLGFEGDRCGVVDYEDLTPDLARGISRFFGLPVEGNRRRAIEEIFRVDAKDRSRKFRGDTNRKQAAITASMRESADRWINDSYRELRERSREFTARLLQGADS